MDIDSPLNSDIACRFDSLYQWLNHKYRLEPLELTVCGERYRLFKIADLERVLDEALENAAFPEEHTPYWAELWPSALALGQYLSKATDLRGREVLELGCGIGLTGIIAHHHEATVVMSDIEEDALRMAELNWIIGFGELPSLIRLDWHDPALDRVFDMLIASDVAYEKRLFRPFIDTVKQLLAPEGCLLLSEPNRPVAKEFFQMLEGEGFHLERFIETVQYPFRKMEISIYRIRRRG